MGMEKQGHPSSQSSGSPGLFKGELYAWLCISSCLAGNVFIEMGIFEMDASAIKNLRSSTYRKKKKAHYQAFILQYCYHHFPRRILKFREVK